jgi:hypothetical protein
VIASKQANTSGLVGHLQIMHSASYIELMDQKKSKRPADNSDLTSEMSKKWSKLQQPTLPQTVQKQ